MRVPSPDGHRPWGRAPVGIVATCSKGSALNTFTIFNATASLCLHLAEAKCSKRLGVATSPSTANACAQALSLLHLHLHRFAGLRRRPNSDNQIPLRRCAGALCNLTDGTDGVDDGGACRIRHEPSERFQSPSAFWIVGERQHKWLLGRQSGYCSLHHLHEALIK